MDKYGFQYNERTAESYGIYIESRPDIPGKKRKVSYKEVSGNMEMLTEKAYAYENREIAVKCSFKEPEEQWNRKRRQMESWLSGEGELIFSDDAEVFWKVKEVQISKFERKLRKYGTFVIKFSCSPFEYMVDGKIKETVLDKIDNPYDMAQPIYYLRGEGLCILTVNGKTIQANVSRSLIIDTERMLTYREDKTLQNTAITGEYEDLYLNPGRNRISVSPGFVLQIKPNWRCL